MLDSSRRSNDSTSERMTELIMKTLKRNELYENLSQFLSDKGIEFKDGSYTQGIHRACSLLTEAINGAQKTVQRAKTQVDEKVDQVRRVIHKSTAPKAAKTQPTPTSEAAAQAATGTKRPRIAAKRAPKTARGPRAVRKNRRTTA
jgi:hypothetical protein